MKTKLAILAYIITATSFAQEWKDCQSHNSLYAKDQYGGANIKGIGIGTNNPSARLDVFGRVKLHSTLILDTALNIGSKLVLNGQAGTFKNTTWAGTGNRLLQTDANGNVIVLPVGSSNQVLLGNGTWGSIPTPTNIWQQNGYGIYYTGGKVGVGTNNPLVALDVIGDARVSNNLYVGGGIVITDKVNANLEIKSFDIKVDNDLSVESNSRFKGNNRLDNGFTFDGVNGVTYQTTAAGGTILNLGKTTPLPPANTCIAPYAGLMTNFSNRAIITFGTAANSNVLDFTNDGQNGYIDYGFDISLNPKNNTSGVPIPALKINSVCWGDVEIAKGGGFASMGRNLEVGNPVRNSLIASNILASGVSVGQRITKKAGYLVTNTNPPAQYNTQLFVDRNLLSALSVFNTQTNATGDETFTLYGDGKTQINAATQNNKYFSVIDNSNTTSPVESFVVYGDGKTAINSSSTDAFTISSKFTNTINFKVKTNGIVYAREINVATGSFPDYVFSKNYELIPLLDLEKYINKNNHLKGFEKAACYEKNGMPIGEIIKLQQEKIEELTLYLIQLKKEMNEFKLDKK